MATQLTASDLRAVEREYCARRLVNFVRCAWPIVEPASEYVHNWHIDAICEHLEAVTRGDITRLLINVPPGAMKSLLTAVFWPAWEWGPKALPETRFVSASYSETYALRDARRMRQVIRSDWFQKLWPLNLMADQNAAGKYENERMGFRHAMPVRSMTGSRGDRVLWDDPHSVEGAISPADLATTGRIFHETLPTRLNSPERSAIVIIMQRLAVNDVAGLALAEDHGYEHLMLPMEYEPDRKCSTCIGFTDPRAKPDELLFPERFPAHVVARDKRVMGLYAVAGQFQQRPAPRGGGMFPVDAATVLAQSPPESEIAKSVRYWDKAGTQGGGAYTAGVLMHQLVDGRFVVGDLIRGQWQAPDREKRIRQTAVIDGPETKIWIEQEPGSGGKESAQASIKNLAGFVARADKVTGDKETRAEGYAVQFEAGNVCIVRAPWNRAFLAEHEVFPVGRYKDQVDAAAGAFAKLGIRDQHLIDYQTVTRAMDRDLRPEVFLPFPKYIGVAVANQAVIIRRQGPKVWAPQVVDDVAAGILEEVRAFNCRNVFMDSLDLRLDPFDLDITDAQTAEPAVDHKRFSNRAMENWHRMREWLNGEVDLPVGVTRLRTDLTAREYTFDRKQRMVLETEDALIERMVEPPVYANALAMTFADFSGHRKARAQQIRQVRWA